LTHKKSNINQQDSKSCLDNWQIEGHHFEKDEIVDVFGGKFVIV
jgi:hypothetical protein